MSKRIAQFYRYLTDNWNVILAVISVMGIALFSIIPQLQQYTDFFIFLGFNAVVWTLVDIKVAVNRNEDIYQFDSFRHARPLIVSEIRTAINKSRRGSEILQISMIGGRIRTISDLLREIRREIDMNIMHGKNMKITLCCIDPEFIRTWGLSDGKLSQDALHRNKVYSDLIPRLVEEVVGMNELPLFKERNISIDVFYYKAPPLLYCYIVGQQSLFWGQYHWDAVAQDFEGTSNVCYFVPKSHSTYSSVHSWLLSHVEFFKLS